MQDCPGRARSLTRQADLRKEDEALLASLRKALADIWADPVFVRHIAMSRATARAVERYLSQRAFASLPETRCTGRRCPSPSAASRPVSCVSHALTSARIGAVYGAGYVNPYNALYGATASAMRSETDDPLCHLARAVSTICDMRCPDGPSGTTETPKELMDALPDLKRARASLDGFISKIEKLRLVA